MQATPTIITCAVTGAAALGPKSGALPITPEQIASSCIEAASAGAAVVHIHVRNTETGAASMDLAQYREVVERVRERNPDVLLNLTMGAGARFIPGAADPLIADPRSSLALPAERVRHVVALRPDICSLDIATMNFGEHSILNTPTHLREMADAVVAAGVKPELEVFDLGQIELAKYMIAQGTLPEPPFFQLCLGVRGGSPATPRAMMALRDLLPSNAAWSGFGISAQSFPMVGQAMLLGGHVRVGLEDNLYLARGQLATSNAQLVERAVSIIQALGGAVATTAQARQLLSLPPR